MARPEMRWEMGFSASEIASTAFSNPKIQGISSVGVPHSCKNFKKLDDK
jgi:hypothetical protein